MEEDNTSQISKKITSYFISALGNVVWVKCISIVLLLVIFYYVVSADMWGDLNNYYQNASEVLKGLMPYSEAKFEYPPLALVFMVIPCALSWNKESFFIIYTVLVCLFFFIGVHYIFKVTNKYCDEKWQPGALIISLLLFGTYFIIARYDIFPATVVVIGLWMYLNKKYVPAFVLIAIATMIKLYPGIFLLAMILPMIINRDWKICGKSLFSVVVVCLLAELPFLITDPSTAFAYLSYHSERGIQIESVVGSVFLVYQMIASSDISVIFAYGCDALSGVGPDSVAPWMNPLLFASLIVFIGIMYVRCRHLHIPLDNLLCLSTLLMLALLLLFIAFSKVYSAQYVIWIAMMIPFTQLSCFDKVQRIVIFKVYLLLGVFSFLSYITYLPMGLTSLNLVPVLLTVLKNVLLVILLCVVLHYCWLWTSSKSVSS